MALTLPLGVGLVGCDGTATKRHAPAAYPTRTVGTVTVDINPPLLAAELGSDPAKRPWPDPLEPPRDAPLLQDSPMASAVLLYQPYPVVTRDGWESPQVYVYGGDPAAGFHWARIDLGLVVMQDDTPGKTTTFPVTAGSLGPGGEFAAFVQPETVVVLAIRTAAVTRVPLPGGNFALSWLGDGKRVLVSSAVGNRTLDVFTGVVQPSSVRATDYVIPYGDARGVMSITDQFDVQTLSPVKLHIMDDLNAPAKRDHSFADVTETFTATSATLNGFRYLGRIAVTVGGRTPLNPAHTGEGGGVCASDGKDGAFLMVVDEATGTVTHILWLTTDPYDFTVEVVGWLGPSSILLSSWDKGLVSWDLELGTLTQLSRVAKPIEILGPTIAVAPRWPDLPRQSIAAFPAARMVKGGASVTTGHDAETSLRCLH